jgi:hypothetical protein
VIERRLVSSGRAKATGFCFCSFPPESAGEIVSKLVMDRAFSPSLPIAITSWGFAPGWYSIAPLALMPLKIKSLQRRRRTWGEAPGMHRTTRSRGKWWQMVPVTIYHHLPHLRTSYVTRRSLGNSPGWSAAARRATPGNGEEDKQALEGRQTIQKKVEVVLSPGLLLLLRFTPGYGSFSASGAKK